MRVLEEIVKNKRVMLNSNTIRVIVHPFLDIDEDKSSRINVVLEGFEECKIVDDDGNWSDHCDVLFGMNNLISEFEKRIVEE